MEIVEILGWMILLIILLTPFYRLAVRNTDYKRRQRYGTLQHHENGSRR